MTKIFKRDRDKSQLLELINSFSTKLVNQKADIVLLKSKILVLRKTYAKKIKSLLMVLYKKFKINYLCLKI